MKKTWLFLACVSCSALALFAQNASDFQTELANGQVTITDYSGSETNVRIPDRINGMPVTAIGEWAFALTPLTSVVIPNSVTTIGEGAFRGTQLTRVVIPNSVTTIGERAFDDDVKIIRTDSGAKKSVSTSSILTVVNNTGYTFYYLYISPSDSDTWGRDVLGDQVLYDRQSFRYALPYNGTWDIMAEDSDEDTYTRRLTVTADTTLALTLDDLD
ncbi:MAG: leucine-rich repeat domain-containing protein [Treponema sp.]|nr:leucine-rich repeat domain-containing protein [Treponema sp.]